MGKNNQAYRTSSTHSSSMSTSTASSNAVGRAPYRRPKNHFHMDEGTGNPMGSENQHKTKFSDILLMRRLRLNRARTTTASSLSDSISESNNSQQQILRGTNSNSLLRNNSVNSCQSGRSHRSTRSNATTLTALSSLTGSSSSGSAMTKKGKMSISYIRVIEV